MRVKDCLELLALVIQIISFPIAAWSIYWARKEAKASRDVQIGLALAESFRTRWEQSWSVSLYEAKQAQKADGTKKVPVKYRDPIFQMLNWIDWLGTLIRTQSLSNTEIILGSIAPQFVDIIRIGEPLLFEDEEYGPQEWQGLFRVVEELQAKGRGLDLRMA